MQRSLAGWLAGKERHKLRDGGGRATTQALALLLPPLSPSFFIVCLGFSTTSSDQLMLLMSGAYERKRPRRVSTFYDE